MSISTAEFLSRYTEKTFRPGEDKFFEGVLDAFQLHVKLIEEAPGKSSFLFHWSSFCTYPIAICRIFPSRGFRTLPSRPHHPSATLREHQQRLGPQMHRHCQPTHLQRPSLRTHHHPQRQHHPRLRPLSHGHRKLHRLDPKDRRHHRHSNPRSRRDDRRKGGM